METEHRNHSRILVIDDNPADVDVLIDQPAEVLARVRTQLALRQLQRQLAAQNAQLQQEIAERARAEAALQRANADLEQRVAARTAELSRHAGELQAA